MPPREENLSLEPLADSEGEQPISGVEAGASPEIFPNPELISESGDKDKDIVIGEQPGELPEKIEIPLPPSIAPIATLRSPDAIGSLMDLQREIEQSIVSPQQAVEKLTKSKTRFEDNLEKGFSGL